MSRKTPDPIEVKVPWRIIQSDDPQRAADWLNGWKAIRTWADDLRIKL